MGGIAWSRPQIEDEVENEVIEENKNLNEEDRGARREKHKQDLENFKQMLQRKREERKQAITRISEEMNELRKNADDLEKERTLRVGLEKQVKALKEVSLVSNEMLQLRETQVTELKKRLHNLETTAEENLTNLRNQYENQIGNIRKLRQLYEERAEAAARGHEKEMEKERAKNTLLELKLEEHANDAVTIQQLNEKIEKLEEKVSEKDSQNEELKELRNSLVAECNNLTSQQTLINNLFSNMLTGEMDFDLLTQLLQDNHNLITDLIANGDINDTAALLVNIAEKTYKKQETGTPVSTSTKEEIATNLPKVWRMLIELLSTHEDSIHVVQGTSDECYKHVKTPTGSRTVISVSQTFLRLKDLILEKNSLVKEVGRLKTLNGHLENRLDQQEKRLSVVSSELKKTWGIVSKLKVQHRQLHTHEKILRYELQHKRQMLTDLKHELEYCRETWDRAKEKNTQNEHDWELLRKEFALRKSRDTSNSTESGYEDDENSQSPDISTSELEYDLSDSQKSSEMNSPSIELEDAASDATVIELIDMLEFEDESQGQDDKQVFYDTSEDITRSPEGCSSEGPERLSASGLKPSEEFDRSQVSFESLKDCSEVLEPAQNTPESSNNEPVAGNCLDSGSKEKPPECSENCADPKSPVVRTPSQDCLDTTQSHRMRSPPLESPQHCPPEPNSTDDARSQSCDAQQPISSCSTDPPTKTFSKRKSSEEILAARAARLRRLEQQCKSLLNQMALTSLRSDTLSTRLEELHEQYGSEERPERRSEPENTESEQTTVAESDQRQSRLQQMEQNCIEMLENVSNGAEVNVRLENICVSSHESNPQNEPDEAGNECDNVVNESTQ